MNDQVAAWLNTLEPVDAADQFRRLCGAEEWIARMVDARPFADDAAVALAAEHTFDAMPPDAWLDAFACHPRIGDLDSLRMKFAGNDTWSSGEQAGAAASDERTLQRLADGNEAYLDRFGYIFIVCATGKSAAEMLGLLEARLSNSAEAELPVAAAEQRKITQLRVQKLIATGAPEEKP